MLLVYSATFPLCLLSVLFLLSLPSPPTIHVQLCLHRYASWWGFFNHTHHAGVSEKGRGRQELGKQHCIVLRTRALSAAPCCQGLQIQLGKTTPASLWRADQRYACLQLVLYPPAYFKKRQTTGTNTTRGFNKENI